MVILHFMNDNKNIKIIVVGSSKSDNTLFVDYFRNHPEKAVTGYDFSWSEADDPETLPSLRPDIIVQVVDSMDLDESLVMTPQLIDMHLKIVLVFNHYNKLLATDHSIDFSQLGTLMGLQATAVDVVKEQGIDSLLRMIVDAVEGKSADTRHLHVNYGGDVESAVSTIVAEMAKIPEIDKSFSKRYLSIRLLESPEAALARLPKVPAIQNVADKAEACRVKLERSLHRSPADIIHEARHGFISGALNATLSHSNDHSDHTRQQRIDAILTNRWVGFPILAVVLYLVFQCTFFLGAFPQEWIQSGVDALASALHAWWSPTWLSSLLIDGVLEGVGAVLAFLPNIIILFFFISIMEDSGYMARIAFLMDKIMHRVGLHGRSFVPMLVGFGCNVPAIMAARDIDNRKDRALTMLMIPFMSCSARLPVYMLFVGAFFPSHKALVMMSLYLIGVLLSIIFALVMKRTKYFRQPNQDYVSELPAFRMPVLRNTASHIWERCADYLKKISTVILWASIIIWALYYFPRHEELTKPYNDRIAELRLMDSDATLSAAQRQSIDAQIDSLMFVASAVQKEHSALASVGHWMEPVTKPLGFDWRLNVCILTGLPAKEAIVSTLGIVFHQDNEDSLEAELRNNPFFTPLKAYAFLLFVLLYFPCVATIATLRRFLGTKWAAFTVVNSLVLAWLVSFLVYNIGSLL